MVNLSEADEQINKLKKNVSRVEEIANAISDLRQTRDHMDNITDRLEKKITKTIDDFKELEKELKALPVEIKKESSSIETSLNLRIADLEKEIRGNIDSLKKEISDIKNDIKSSTDENSKQLSSFKEDLHKSIDEKLRSTNRNITFVILLGLIMLGLFGWYVFTNSDLF